MDVYYYLLGILLTITWFGLTLSTDKDIGNKAEDNNLTADQIPQYVGNSDLDTYNSNTDHGSRMWLLKRIAKKMEQHRSRRNILGILKDSVSNNLSDLLLHALDEQPPSDYKFRGSVWTRPRDSSFWRNSNSNHPAKNSKPQSSGDAVDPMMKWVGIGK